MYNKQRIGLLIVSLACAMPMQAMLGKVPRLSTRKIVDCGAHSVVNGALGGMGLGSAAYFTTQGINRLLEPTKGKNPASAYYLSDSTIIKSTNLGIVSGYLGFGLVTSHVMAGRAGHNIFLVASMTGAAAIVAAIKAKKR